MIRGHHLDRLSAHQARAVELSSTEKHLAEPEIVLGGSRQPARSAEVSCGSIGRSKRRELFERSALFRISGGEPRQAIFGQIKPRVVHSQRRQNPLTEELVERLP